MTKKKIFLFSFITLFFGCGYFLGVHIGAWTNPFKERASWAPDFDLYAFKFEDYSTYEVLKKNLSFILVEGLPMKEVDKALVDSAGAKKIFIGKLSHKNEYRYCYMPLLESLKALMPMTDRHAYTVFVTYDLENKIQLYKTGVTLASNCKAN